MSQQVTVRLPDAVVVRLDEIVSGRGFESRAEALREAVERFIDAEVRRRIGQQIVAGYEQHPQTDDEVAAATAAAISSIEEEPW